MTSEPEHRSWDVGAGRSTHQNYKHGMANNMAQRDAALPHAVAEVA